MGERVAVNDQQRATNGIGRGCIPSFWRMARDRPGDPPRLGGFAQLDPYGCMIARILFVTHIPVDTGSLKAV